MDKYITSSSISLGRDLEVSVFCVVLVSVMNRTWITPIFINLTKLWKFLILSRCILTVIHFLSSFFIS